MKIQEFCKGRIHWIFSTYIMNSFRTDSRIEIVLFFWCFYLWAVYIITSVGWGAIQKSKLEDCHSWLFKICCCALLSSFMCTSTIRNHYSNNWLLCLGTSYKPCKWFASFTSNFVLSFSVMYLCLWQIFSLFFLDEPF